MKSRFLFWMVALSFLIGFVLALIPRSAVGQGEYASAIGEPYNAAVNAVASNIYVASRSYDLRSHNAMRVRYQTGPAVMAGQTNYVKNQWSDNNSNWVDEAVLVAGTVSGGEAPYTVNSRVLQMIVTNANTQIYSERVNRLDRFFRVMTKSDAAVSTSQVTVVFLPLNN